MTLNIQSGYLAEGDPSFSNVSLLLHGNGTNGSTTITDSSPSPKTVTAVGNAQISTTQSKFGGSSIAFDGAGDYALIPSNLAFVFGSGNFTIEAWIYPRSFGDFDAIVTNYQGNDISWLFSFLSNGILRFQTSNILLAATSPSAVTLNEWSHVTVTRASNTFTIFINGTQQGVGTNSLVLSQQANVTVGGDIAQSTFFDGFIDDLRITKGVARYTANFTPPDAPFPDAQY